MTERGSNQSRRNDTQGHQNPQQPWEKRGEFQSSDQVRTALISGNTFRGKAVQYAVRDGLAIFEGDIILGPEQQVTQSTQQLRQEIFGGMVAGVVITGDQYRWPNCTIPYTIDSGLPNQARVTDAIAHWQSNTGVKFVARSSETDYVTFLKSSSGCASYVGKQGGQQSIYLHDNCTTGNAIHEIGHTVGLWHEHSREDRDAFVTIHWDKIQSGYEHNFNQHISDGDDVGAYDYGSIMHYPRDAFSIDGSDTITPVDPAAQIGQRNGLSAGDIAAVSSFCPTIVTPVKPVIKDAKWYTLKEMVKDIRFDTKKELVLDTRKELVSDVTLKEKIKDQIKDVALDPGKLGPSDQIYPPQTRPVSPLLPGLTGTGRVPFVVATPHQAPTAANEQAEYETAATNLDAQLQALADQLAQAEAAKELLQAQYNETQALLQQALEAHDKISGLQSGQ